MKKYIVREGDSMWKISKRTGVRLPLLTAANPQIRDPNQLQPGTVILIPELQKGQAGPKSTAGKTTGTGVPVGAEAQAGASPGMAPPGGGALTTGPRESIPPYFGFVWPHVVQPGETWQSISQAYQVPVSQLQQMNTSHKSTLAPGDIVYVPGTGPSPAVPLTHPGAAWPEGAPSMGPGAGQPVAADHTGVAPPMTPPGYPTVPEPQVGGYPSGAPMYPPAPGPGYPPATTPGPEYGYPPGAYPGPHTHFPYRMGGYPYVTWGMPYPPSPYGVAYADGWDDWDDSSSWAWDSESIPWNGGKGWNGAKGWRFMESASEDDVTPGEQ
ncbi:MAG: LysM peptidoglycan-binding domain-containing protein [Alicyclobacillus herbarius]|uniref:LysM peptidoglycan-binding domain-containing protein n=1 Tax=Alicyclobacillus herbarius TaxID=122960 RepID=UPI002357FA95|nr:LysM peptidoglycan-binding domain-containing protein [Alicyclobacillus herbarius]MCL6632310.1 LysM peptidoglycan-binding domain-containing protein [Alicyclobacillus herbarius]